MIYNLEWMIPGVGMSTLSAVTSGDENGCVEIDYFQYDLNALKNPELASYVEDYIEQNEQEIADCLLSINAAIGVCITYNPNK